MYFGSRCNYDIQCINFIGMGWGQISTLKNHPTCNFAPRVVTIYKLHWDGVESNFNVEK